MLACRAARPPQLKIEIGAGAGEWAAVQAAEDDKVANWATLELRLDRVYQTFTRVMFGKMKNLCAIGGDALEVLQQRFAAESVSGMFINHPEPPERTGGTDDSQGQHLLTAEFFAAAKKILHADGDLTLVTDNLAYGKSLVATCANAGFASTPLVSKGPLPLDYPIIHRAENVLLYEGTPGSEAGHNVPASSYFDRMWTSGKKTRRFFFCVHVLET